MGGGSRVRPHEYEEARVRLLSDIHAVNSHIGDNPEMYLDQRIVCVRLESTFGAESHGSSSILSVSDELKFVGGRKYAVRGDRQQVSMGARGEENRPELAKLYFLRTTSRGIGDLEKALLKDTGRSKAWRNEIMSIRSLDFLAIEEKVLGFDGGWETEAVEVVLHPFEGGEVAAIDLFCRVSGLGAEKIKARTYRHGITYIAACMPRETVMSVARINPLRTVRPLGRLSFEPVL